MTTYAISKWFHVEADSYEEAWEIAGEIGELVVQSEDIPCDDSGDIDVEEVEE